MPLIAGETYWMHGDEIDVAVVDDASMAALADATRAVDLRGFLARELQYGPLDLARARDTLLRGWLEANDALCIEVGEPALTNGKRIIERRRGPTAWEPWSEDARILVRSGSIQASAVQR